MTMYDPANEQHVAYLDAHRASAARSAAAHDALPEWTVTLHTPERPTFTVHARNCDDAHRRAAYLAHVKPRGANPGCGATVTRKAN